ncbi:MAG: hypothetical protein P4L51_01745 [Puia sp.]|nr:hypothetical protein [Puia sp.]
MPKARAANRFDVPPGGTRSGKPTRDWVGSGRVPKAPATPLPDVSRSETSGQFLLNPEASIAKRRA